MGLYTDKYHLVFKWNNPRCKVLFSVCKRGAAASCHFACDSKGLRFMRVAMKEFSDFLFESFDWCERLLAMVTVDSVKRLIKKIGFVHAGTADGHDIFIRGRL